MARVNKDRLRRILIETAIEKLSTGNEEPDIGKARRMLEDLLETLTTEVEVSIHDPLSKRTTYEMQTRSFLDVGMTSLPIETEVLSKSIETYWNNKNFKHKIIKDAKISDWLKVLKQAAFFIPHNEIVDFIKWTKHFVEDIQYTCEHGDVRKDNVNGLHMKFDSTVKGVGKSFFIKNIIEGAKELGIEAKDEVYMPRGGFNNSIEESRNLIIGYNEADNSVDETTLKNIGRREHYRYNVKYASPMDIQSRAITLGSSNGYDYCKDDRSFVTFHCIPAKFQNYPEKIQKMASDVIRYISTIYKLDLSNSWISGFLDNKIFKKNINENNGLQNLENWKMVEFLRCHSTSRLLLDVLTSLNGDLEQLSSISVAKLSKLYKKYTGTELTYPQRRTISALLNNMVGARLIQKTNYETDDQYRQFNIQSLIGIKNEDLFENLPVSIDEDIQMAQDEWDRIIKLAEDYENNEPDPDENKPKNCTDDEKLINNINKEREMNGTDVYNRLYDTDLLFTPVEDRLDSYTGRWFLENNKEVKFEDLNISQQYVALNKPLKDPPEPEHLRKNINFTGNNFCFEIDDLPFEDQKNLIAKFYTEHKDNVLWICSSGNKSIHCVVHTNCESNDTNARRYIQQYFNDKYFEGHLDMSTVNAGRLCRNPNGIRDNGKHQTAYYINENAKPLDVKKLLNEYEDERQKLEEQARLRRWYREEVTNLTERVYKKRPLTVDNIRARHVTPGRESAIRMLQGNAGWNEVVGGCMYLLHTGYEDEDIWGVLPGDEWIENALKEAHKRIGE